MPENNERDLREEAEINPEPAVAHDGAEAAAVPANKKHNVLWAIATLLCLAALVVGAGLTYTAFTANDYLKSVAVTRPSQSLFASDKLAPYSTTEPQKIEVRPVIADTVAGDTNKCQVTFRIYNCMLDDPNVFNDKEVEYSLTVEAEGVEGGQWSISPTAGTYTTPATRGEIKTFTITFDKSLLDKCSFTVKATVNRSNSPGTSLAMLAAVIAPAQRAEVQSASVQGAWEGEGLPRDYDAYNYRITVTGQTKMVKLTWGEAIELDPFFETNHADCSIDRANRTVTFSMEPGSEVVSFFRAGNVPEEWEDFGVSALEAE